MGELLIKENLNNGSLCCALEGELDLSTAPKARARLDNTLEDTGVLRLILDLRKVTFIDSAGIGLILGRYRKIKLLGGEMEMLVNSNLLPVLELAAIPTIIPVRSAEMREKSS